MANEKETEIVTYFDYWGDVTPYYSLTKEIRGGLFYYLLTESGIRNNTNQASSEDEFRKKILVPPTDAVQSVVWMPYLNDDDFNVRRVLYDTKRFPIAGLTDDDPGYDAAGYLWRIEGTTQDTKELGKFKCYKKEGSTGGTRDWRNESRLYDAPFCYGILYDGVSAPFQFNYRDINTKTNEATVRAHVGFNNTGTYGFFIDNFRGDTIGSLEGIVNRAPNMLPVVSSAYTNFMAQSGALFAVNKQQAEQQGQFQQTKALYGTIGSIATAGVGGAAAGSMFGPVGMALGAAAGVASSIVGGVQDYQGAMNRHKQLLAQEKDLRKAPNQVTSMGSDFLYNRDSGPGSLYHVRYKLKEENLKKIGDFFAMYGYEQNKLMKPNTRNRYHYNYIKTVDANISGMGIPKAHLDTIRDILNRGTTIWHIDRAGVEVGDYSMDNYEV